MYKIWVRILIVNVRGHKGLALTYTLYEDE